MPAAQAAPAPASPYPTSVPAAQQYARSRRPGIALALGAILLVVLASASTVAVVAMRGHVSQGGGTSKEQEELQRIKQQMLRSSDLPQSGISGSAETDATESQARRQLQRLRREAGMAEPAADASGKVHLQGGATMSAEEWRRTQRALSGQ